MTPYIIVTLIVFERQIQPRPGKTHAFCTQKAPPTSPGLFGMGRLMLLPEVPIHGRLAAIGATCSRQVEQKPHNGGLPRGTPGPKQLPISSKLRLVLQLGPRPICRFVPIARSGAVAQSPSKTCNAPRVLGLSGVMTTSKLPLGWSALLGLAVSAPTWAQCPVAIDLNPGPGFSRPAFYHVAFGQELYFALTTQAMGLELWKWSPATGVVLAADVKTGGGTSRPEGMTACCTAQGPRVFFSAAGTGINTELWATDGAAGSFWQVAEIRPGSSGSLPNNLVPVGNRVFFTANDGTTGNELWVSGGTAGGTYLVKDIRAGTNSNPSEMTALRDKLLFTADDGTGRELWVSDGTAVGTVALGPQVPSLGTSPYELTTCGDVVFFTTGNELWKTDGTVAGTVLVQDVASKWPGARLLRNFVCCGARLFFAASVTGAGRLLFVSDGTDAGTYRVQNDPFTATSVVGLPVCSNGRLFFVGTHSSSGYELWVSDGTHAGTVLAADIVPGTQGSSPSNLVAVGTGVCFSADDGTNGDEPWFSDGIAAGTFMLCDLDPAGSSSPSDMYVVGGQLWMMATQPTIGTEPHVLATPGAYVQRLGGAGAPDYPDLSSVSGAPPVLGSTMQLAASGPTGHLGVLFAGALALPAPPIPGLLQGGCDWTGLSAGTAVGLVSTTASSMTVPITMPGLVALEGLQLGLQAVWADPLSSPPIQLSNGLQLVIGAAVPH